MSALSSDGEILQSEFPLGSTTMQMNRMPAICCHTILSHDVVTREPFARENVLPSTSNEWRISYYECGSVYRQLSSVAFVSGVRAAPNKHRASASELGSSALCAQTFHASMFLSRYMSESSSVPGDGEHTHLRMSSGSCGEKAENYLPPRAAHFVGVLGRLHTHC